MNCLMNSALDKKTVHAPSGIKQVGVCAIVTFIGPRQEWREHNHRGRNSQSLSILPPLAMPTVFCFVLAQCLIWFQWYGVRVFHHVTRFWRRRKDCFASTLWVREWTSLPDPSSPPTHTSRRDRNTHGEGFF